MSLDLNKLANKLDEALSNETSETLSKFLNDKRMTNNKQQTAVKLYTEQQVKQIQQAILCNHKDAIMDENYCLNVAIPIELSSGNYQTTLTDNVKIEISLTKNNFTIPHNYDKQ